MMLYSKRAVSRINDLITRFACGSLGLVHVNEYPKCGGTWIARLIRSYYGVSRKYGVDNIVRPNSVIQKHTLYTPHYKKPVIVARDPRDVWVSYFFYEIYHHQGTTREVVLNGFNQKAPEEANLVTYIKEKSEYPENFDPGYSYAKFVDSWIDKPQVHLVRYEDVHADAEATLKGIMEYLGETNIDDEKIRLAVKENTFEKITGRQSGTQDKFSHKRKGVVGDWKNIFNKDSCKIVYETQQELLEKLGYESNGSWVNDFTD